LFRGVSEVWVRAVTAEAMWLPEKRGLLLGDFKIAGSRTSIIK
jgi:hypothetical protein